MSSDLANGRDAATEEPAVALVKEAWLEINPEEDCNLWPADCTPGWMSRDLVCLALGPDEAYCSLEAEAELGSGVSCKQK